MTIKEKSKIEVTAIKTTAGLLCSTGKVNAYRMAFYLGRGGSRTEETWNEKNHEHGCCKSRCSWRHKKGCPKLKGNEKWQKLGD